ncbi:hypothetical protein JQX09_17965 [Sulfitobacter pseudonitzschiae]|uniref:Uncharacterized protein n=1 Tax=Pseudosulfitobacter pseudonitzschiae TaxID=1402135 RepID=A0A9Q2NN67_9RHOB|nr:hypothetical protein [Pseudosulfitobacter pseudonitzschiae]MBM2293818.1 hypothetical protein [Pseudosulfitobacter pseudonitzschiae]MBM2298735.1 hypothetical protein [Pseudosulfitobacter pseudonitzschiae]MBM2303650.1 hypothetical protein [Pseudosulfitobacter pseudonitzschiae]MBM2313432.1 hypothetical protein [Pseudosulfitobacter pseudonitzschiae]MBM2318346.1 hypothetical protein [Pseudosulfitobacter pseudonitzschiae]
MAENDELKGMGPVEVVSEFRKGCTNTIGKAPETCSECLSAASQIMQGFGFSEEEAISLLSDRKLDPE